MQRNSSSRSRTGRRTRLLTAVVCVSAVVAAAGVTTGAAAASSGEDTTARARAERATAETDFNNDGYADLAVGVPDGTVSGHAQAGFVAVQWGGPDGLSSANRTLVSQDTAGVPGIAEAGDRFGAGVDAADVDKDGYTDLIAGAPKEDNGLEGRGAVSVVWGGESGFTGGLTVANQPEPYGELGGSVVADDFTHDGETDIVFNSTDEESGGASMVAGPIRPGGTPKPAERVDSYGMGGGTAHLTSGDFDGDGQAELASTVSALETSNARVLRWSNGKPERIWNIWGHGSSLASGDFDGDGRDDLAVGDCRDGEVDGACGPAAAREGGGVHVAFGDSDPASFGSRTQTFGQNTGGVPDTVEPGDSFGTAVSAADVNGDGKDDLAVGNPGESVGSAGEAGQATVLLGGADGLLDASGNARGSAWHQNSPDVPGTAESGDRFAAALRLLDTDSDNAAELLVGSPGENDGTGGVWQLPGTADGPAAPGSRVLSPPAGAPSFGEVLAR